MSVLQTIGDGLSNAFLMAWQVWWALVLGFAISGVVQAWVPRARIERALGGSGARPVALATGLGAASSSCSYAAIAIAKSLFTEGRLGGVGAGVPVRLDQPRDRARDRDLDPDRMAVHARRVRRRPGADRRDDLLLRLFVSRRLEREAREHAQAADTGHQHHSAGEQLSLARAADSVVGLVGRRSQLPRRLADALEGDRDRLPARRVHRPAGQRLLQRAVHRARPGPLRLAENVIVGPIIAVLSFVCSIGNVPLAAVLWSGGISFAGVVAFLFADLIVIPIVLIYRKYYGGPFTVRIVALMFVSMIIAALAVDALFSGTRADPARTARAWRHLQLGQARLQVRAQRAGDSVVRGSLRPDDAARHHRSGVRHARGPP